MDDQRVPKAGMALWGLFAATSGRRGAITRLIYQVISGKWPWAGMRRPFGAEAPAWTRSLALGQRQTPDFQLAPAVSLTQELFRRS